jgi:(2R)-3-sulfolactate dehydrogenase (NADP+)
MKYSISDVHALCTEAFTACKVTSAQAGPTIDALILAEAQGLASHGISRVPMYLAHVTHGRVNPNAVPVIQQQSASAALINADNGFAFPACNQAIKLAIQKASETGIAVGAVTNSHHFGVAGNHLRAIADAGLVGWAMGNSPAAMPAWGGKRAIFGTNPIAAIFRYRRLLGARLWLQQKTEHRFHRAGHSMRRVTPPQMQKRRSLE